MAETNSLPDSRSADRPPVSVIVPFLGNKDKAEELLETLLAMHLRLGDEVVVADNTPRGVFCEAARDTPIRVVRSTGERSSYHTRNVGAINARNDWFLFIDSDCSAPAEIVDAYFSEPIEPDEGAIAGPMLPMVRRSGVMSRYAMSRMGNEQSGHVTNHFRPFGATANLLVRRAAWQDVGGFLEGARSGGDADFCWRIQDHGWRIGYRQIAPVRHYMREDMRSYLQVHARYTAGRHWLMRRWPSSDMGPKLQRIPRFAAAGAYWLVRGKREKALFKGIDITVVVAEGAGYLFGNEPPAIGGDRHADTEVAVMVDRFPERSETFVANEARALQSIGCRVRVEARSRTPVPAIGAGWGLDVAYQEDAGIMRQLADWSWLACRHPIACLRDLFSRRRWRREEEVSPLRILAPLVRRTARSNVRHLHAHFARRAALDAMRTARILGLSYSVTAHAWDIFKLRTNLREKLGCAAFATSGCDYNVSFLTDDLGLAPDQVHKVIMGVDPSRFERRMPYKPNGPVIAVGRLIEKKGFEDLIRAIAALRDAGRTTKLVIVGDGRLRPRLEALVDELDLTEHVELAGLLPPEEVRTKLEVSSLLAMPAVIAPDGDRDSMPVVIKEALAMELPVVASREVGIPELVQEGWGRLTSPGDSGELAGAIEEVLDLPANERIRMGARGRKFVDQEMNLEGQATLLMELIRASQPD